MNAPNNFQKLNLDPSQAEQIVCGECGGEFFEPVNKLLKFSKLLTGAPKDTLIQVPVMLCIGCGGILDLENKQDDGKKIQS